MHIGRQPTDDEYRELKKRKNRNVYAGPARYLKGGYLKNCRNERVKERVKERVCNFKKIELYKTHIFMEAVQLRAESCLCTLRKPHQHGLKVEQRPKEDQERAKIAVDLLGYLWHCDRSRSTGATGFDQHQ